MRRARVYHHSGADKLGIGMLYSEPGNVRPPRHPRCFDRDRTQQCDNSPADAFISIEMGVNCGR